MACYALELVHECDAPMMPSVAAAYVLAIDPTDTFPRLHGVARRTYVQRNRTYAACEKGCVRATNQDLTHAYVNLFATTHDRGPVLVFEDDAVLQSTARKDLAVVDAFVARRAFSIYSLGSVGVTVPCGGGHYRYVLFGGLTHAVIYSDAARAVVRAAKPCEVAHIDVSVLRPMKGQYTFARPIAVQSLRVSPNSATWCVACDGSVLDKVLSRASRAMIRVFRLDVDPRAGFRAVYFVQRLHVLLIAALLVAVALKAAYDAM